MSNQPLRKDGDLNPRTIEHARNLVKYVESLFMPWNIDEAAFNSTPSGETLDVTAMLG
jgi:hypothetical protein